MRVDLLRVPVMATDRHMPRIEQAKAARQLFKQLGIKMMSVTTPKYSMASVVEIRLVKRTDYTRDAMGDIDYFNDPAVQANHAVSAKIGAILARAFPKHDDRSDSQSDYFDSCWSIH